MGKVILFSRDAPPLVFEGDASLGNIRIAEHTYRADIDKIVIWHVCMFAGNYDSVSWMYITPGMVPAKYRTECLLLI